MSMSNEHRTPLTKAGRIRTAYSEKLVIALEFPPESEYTDQSFKDECDINFIMAQYQSTGEMPIINEMPGQYLDVTGMDFQQHMDFILQAQAMFNDLPSAIRDRFGNDPAAFLDFTGDENNRLELARMGLLNEEATQAELVKNMAEKPSTPPPVSEGS